LKLSLAPLE